MAVAAARTASKLNIPHINTDIRWGKYPYPDRPTKGQPMEKVARDARYHALFYQLVRSGAKMVAFGHHADDQVETAIMRLSMGSSDLGVSGMRPVRRWGMGESRPFGDNKALGTFGPLGMSRWIVRPLLTVSKDRILATCEKHELEYVNDPTNFQPSLTTRNAIRDYIAREDKRLQGEEPVEEEPKLPEPVKTAIQQLRSVVEVEGDRDLQIAVQRVRERVEVVESQVTNALAYCCISSPPSTIILHSRWLSHIAQRDLCIAMVRRILRYVSPRLWGSVQAEAKGHRKSLLHIVGDIWGSLRTPETRRTFSAGSNVLWVPGVVNAAGDFKRKHTLNHGESFAWYIQRATPLSREKLQHIGKEDTLVRDISDLLVRRPQKAGPAVILYDARFILRFDVAKMPLDVLTCLTSSEHSADSRVIIQPATSWYCPQVIMRQKGVPDEVLADYRWDTLKWQRPIEENARDDSSWVEIEFIRTLGAI
ncbi:uncharacterized protein FIBRA_06604 [Fibroporia radiculosa]|uniref:tRNA(Ile)-lysidine synthetase n=1 Tax=Fibroporia radiculosa TaxID=599839 RepID=J4GT21_9APHY|nr:uncharacterized protein FIBRA_06604 [Fibroporia radiculosa]CCM04425.1 predicted protein [Fibroporia radiculosa]